MAEVKVTLNGKQVTGREGQTILELAQENGIDIPTLCYIKGLAPTGACRVCVVEVENSRALVASCHTPIAPNMVIQTHSPKVMETRKVIIELLLASHCGSCYMCEKANVCELRQMAADHDVGLSRFHAKKRFSQIEDVSPYIQRDMTKCILCRRCVRACREIAKKNVFDIAYRGFDSKVVVDCDKAINKEVCKDCGICLQYCPTGALSAPRKLTDKKTKGKPLVIKG